MHYDFSGRSSLVMCFISTQYQRGLFTWQRITVISEWYRTYTHAYVHMYIHVCIRHLTVGNPHGMPHARHLKIKGPMWWKEAIKFWYNLTGCEVINSITFVFVVFSKLPVLRRVCAYTGFAKVVVDGKAPILGNNIIRMAKIVKWVNFTKTVSVFL